MLQANIAHLVLLVLCASSCVSGEEYKLDWIQQFDASPKTLTVSAGDSVNIFWDYYHDVKQLVDETAFDSCDFTGSNFKATASNGGSVVIQPGAAGTTEYFACSVPTHCSSGQKVAITWAEEGAPVVDTTEITYGDNDHDHDHGPPEATVTDSAGEEMKAKDSSSAPFSSFVQGVAVASIMVMALFS